MKILQSFFLDFARDTMPVTVFAKQNDNMSRVLEIQPTNKGQTYPLDSGVTAKLFVTRRDKHIVPIDGVIADGRITVELTQEALKVPGQAVAEIALFQGETVLSSQVFHINVMATAYESGAPESSDTWRSFIDALNRANIRTEQTGTGSDIIVTDQDGVETTVHIDTAAAAGAEKVNISAEQTPTGATITVTNREGVKTSVHIDTLTAVNTWEDIKNAVRLGLGPKLFPVGYEFEVLDADTGLTIVWVVQAHDHHQAVNGRLAHTMTIVTKHVYSYASGVQKAVQFTQKQALYYAENGLAAGTYHFTVAKQSWYTADNGKNYQFTLTEALPAGGQIGLSASYTQSLEGKSVITYPQIGSPEAIETATLTEGSDGIYLGTTDGTGGMNHLQSVLLASNNYAQSAVRQMINSAEPAGSVWKPQTVFDRPPSWAAKFNGFLHGMPTDFIEAVQAAVVPCRTNSVFEIASLDGTEFVPNQVYTLHDKFFLLSLPEVYGVWENENYKDGEIMEYNQGLTNTEHIQYDHTGVPRQTWMRTAYPSVTFSARAITETGSYFPIGANASNAITVACIIA